MTSLIHPIGMQGITVFFSSPGDLATEKERLVSVVEEMRPVFVRHGVSLTPWTFERDAIPAAAPVGGTVQTVIDRQIPRRSDGSVAYDLYVGLMSRRVGTPLTDAVSGTLHEFLEAKTTFERAGRPHILFYFRQEEGEETADDVQLLGVRLFRAQYPGLFARFSSVCDLEAQFRRHLLSELLDLCIPGLPRAGPEEEWGQRLFEHYAGLMSGLVSFIDKSPEKPRRIMRQLHQLLGVEHQLSGREQKILLAALYCVLLETADRGRLEQLLPGSPELIDQVAEVVNESRCPSKSTFRSGTQARLDLVATLLEIGLRLDISRKGVTATMTSPPDVDLGNVEEWLAYLTNDIVCQRGVLRFHLLAPAERWVTPLIGATAVAIESLWQQVRHVLTQYGMSFAVARSRIEIDSDLEFLPDKVLEQISKVAENAKEELPKFPHFGEGILPTLESLIPLPRSKVRSPVTFNGPSRGAIRLLANGVVVAERGDAEVRSIEYLPTVEGPAECVLECDEVGEFVPVIGCRLERLNAVEAGILDSTPDRLEALRTLGLWNDLLQAIWPRIAGGQADFSELTDAFHILRDALDVPQPSNSLLYRRDLYWDAIEIIRNRIKHFEGVAT